MLPSGCIYETQLTEKCPHAQSQRLFIWNAAPRPAPHLKGRWAALRLSGLLKNWNESHFFFCSTTASRCHLHALVQFSIIVMNYRWLLWRSEMCFIWKYVLGIPTINHKRQLHICFSSILKDIPKPAAINSLTPTHSAAFSNSPGHRRDGIDV